ncbi:hypothetical protein GGR56DRAFT_668840 [Xylariaceae sp. FL0804]|nr:hypothetical protein GGR56DRAFT_668840 [Xylariaceae sp. FL0804]
MHFTTATLSLAAASLLGGLASAQNVHVVSVSSSNGSKIFSPDNLQANAGDVVQFQFRGGNHSVAQSSFDAPCAPVNLHNASAAGIFSGYQDVAAGAATGMVPVWSMVINSTLPMWIYCSQSTHCQAGMSMVINEDTASNATRSLANYRTLAAQVTDNIGPDGTVDGLASTSSTAGTSSSSSGSTSGTSSSGSGTVVTAGAAPSALLASSAVGLLSVACAFLLL